MALWEIILLGIVQGLTEFLPVSSSGHLVVTNAILESLGREKIQDLVEVEVVLHLGTLAAVIGYYRREILRMFTSDIRVLIPLFIATLPAVVVGFSINDHILNNVLLAGSMFIVTAAGLWWISRQQTGELEYPDLKPQQALLIGLLQAFAILPGISRSGATIAGGLAMGLNRQAASTFAFLMAIPTIGGAGLLKGYEAYQEGGTGTSPTYLAVGFLVSMVVGWGALKLLIHWVKQGRLLSLLGT